MVQDNLTQEQVALVLRRAAELDRSLGSPCPTGLDVSAVEQAAMEAGLSQASVRRAVAELQAGLLDGPEPRRRRLLGSPMLTVCRTVPGPAQVVERHLHRFLHDQLFELRRQRGPRTTWVRRRGIEATARRAIDRALQHRLILREVNHIDVSVMGHLTDDDDQWVLVRLDVDVLAARHAQGTLAGSAAVVGGGITAMTAGVATDHPGLLATALAGVGLVGAGHWAGSRLYGRRVGEIESGLAGVLDRLEHRSNDARRFVF